MHKMILLAIMLAMVSVAFHVKSEQPKTNHVLEFCKQEYKTEQGVNDCLDNDDLMNHRTGFFDANGKPLQ